MRRVGLLALVAVAVATAGCGHPKASPAAGGTAATPSDGVPAEGTAAKPSSAAPRTVAGASAGESTASAADSPLARLLLSAGDLDDAAARTHRF